MPQLALAQEDTQTQVGMRRRVVNMSFEPGKDPDVAKILPRSGLIEVNTTGGGPTRASFTWNNHRITVSGTDVFFDGVQIGVVPGTDLVRFAISDTEIVICAALTAWYVTPTAVAAITTGLPAQIVDVLFLGGRFVYLDFNSDTFYYSDIGDARTIDGLNFATAAENSAKTLVGGAVLVDQLVFFLQDTVEWWYVSTDPNNPFTYSQGRRYDRGLAARDTLQKLDNTLFFLGSDKIPYRASSVPIAVGSFSIMDRLSKASAADIAACSAFGIVDRGHPFYVLDIPGQGTWACDVSTGNKWAEWSRYGQTQLQIACNNDVDVGVMGDKLSGTLMQFDSLVSTDLGGPLERVASAFIPCAGRPFRLNSLYLKTVRGVGLTPPQYGSVPVVEMRFSVTEGSDWSDWLQGALGGQGDHTQDARAVWTQLGMVPPPGMLIEFRCTDPVYFAALGLFYNEPRP